MNRLPHNSTFLVQLEKKYWDNFLYLNQCMTQLMNIACTTFIISSFIGSPTTFIISEIIHVSDSYWLRASLRIIIYQKALLQFKNFCQVSIFSRIGYFLLDKSADNVLAKQVRKCHKWQYCSFLWRGSEAF